MKMKSCPFGVTIALLALSTAVFAQSREEARILVATRVVEEMKAMPDQNVPDWLLDRAYGIAVIPSVVKVALGIPGGRRGKGVLVVRNEQGHWSNPVFIALTGGSVGWQLGVQSTDVILVFTTKAGIDGISDGKLTLGADAAVAAGPVGRQTSAATDANFSAEVYSYSRSKGLFAGVALDGTAITIDKKGNADYYSKPGVTASDILSASAPQPPSSARRFLSTLGPKTGNSPARTNQNSDSTPPPENATPEASQLKTYPMEDPNPGQEPPK